MRRQKGSVLLGVVVGLVVIVGILCLALMGTYNSGGSKRNAAIKAWDDVEAAYQRRLDTIPKFAKTAQFSVQFQLKLAKDYAQAREGIKNAATSGNPETLQKNADNAFKGLMSAVRQEAVPEAKTAQLTELNAEIESIERVVNHERKIFNDVVKTNNDAIQSVPNKWFISWFGWNFQLMKGFTAQPGAEKSPDLDLKLE